jgi:hypothetical protein
LPPEIGERVEAELLDGETILWIGRPAFSIAFTGSGSPARLITLISTLLAVLLVAGVVGTAAMSAGRTIFPVIMINILIAVIVAMMAVRAMGNLWRNRHTIYAVTNRRALIIDNTTVQSFRSNDLEFIERRMRSATRGDIIFKRQPNLQKVYYGGGMAGRQAFSEPIGFFGIDNVREVEQLMLETFRPADQGASWPKEKRKHELADEADADEATDSELPQRSQDARR